MEYTMCNDNKTKVSALSLGTWAYSGAKVWGACDDAAAIDAIHCALDNGVNLIDSAEAYGDGQAEILLGKALKDRRSKAVIATKVYSNHLRYNDLITACENSLKRLQTDYIDIYQIHWPNSEVPVEETYRALTDLQKSGKIGSISVCNHGQECMQLVKDWGVLMNQMPYSLLWRVAETHFSPMMQEQNIKLWAYSPLAQGLLTGKYQTLEDVPLNRRTTRMYDCKWGAANHTDHGYEKEIFAFLDWLRTLCQDAGIKMSAMAMGFLKANPLIGSVLVGARTPEQMLDNINAFETAIPQNILTELNEKSAALRDKMGANPDLWENGNGGKGRMY